MKIELSILYLVIISFKYLYYVVTIKTHYGNDSQNTIIQADAFNLCVRRICLYYFTLENLTDIIISAPAPKAAKMKAEMPPTPVSGFEDTGSFVEAFAAKPRFI